LDRALGAQSACDSGERDHSAEHGPDDSVGRISRPGRTWRAGKRLCSGR